MCCPPTSTRAADGVGRAGHSLPYGRGERDQQGEDPVQGRSTHRGSVVARERRIRFGLQSPLSVRSRNPVCSIDLRSDTVTSPFASHARRHGGRRGWRRRVRRRPDRDAPRRSASPRSPSKDAAVFVASGTMGNLSSLLAHCERGRVGDRRQTSRTSPLRGRRRVGVRRHRVSHRAHGRDGTMPLERHRSGHPRPADFHAAPTGGHLPGEHAQPLRRRRRAAGDYVARWRRWLGASAFPSTWTAPACSTRRWPRASRSPRGRSTSPP